MWVLHGVPFIVAEGGIDGVEEQRDGIAVRGECNGLPLMGLGEMRDAGADAPLTCVRRFAAWQSEVEVVPGSQQGLTPIIVQAVRQLALAQVVFEDNGQAEGLGQRRHGVDRA